jgi:hypothetical protein
VQPFLLWKSNEYCTICVLVAMPMRHFAKCPTPLYKNFPHFLINGKILEKNVTEYKMCVVVFSTTSVGNISHSKK